MSNINDNLKIRGDLHVQLFDENGVEKETHDFKNLVVTSGITYICSRMAGTAKAVMGYMALGSGNTAAAAGQTDLVTLLGSRNALDSTTPATSSITYVSTFGAGVSTGAVQEAGIFNAATAGDMLARVTFPVVNKQSGDTMVITWSLTLTAS
jgi:hypothetical protein